MTPITFSNHYQGFCLTEYKYILREIKTVKLDIVCSVSKITTNKYCKYCLRIEKVTYHLIPFKILGFDNNII